MNKMNNWAKYLECAKAVHHMISGYRVSIGEPPYDYNWDKYGDFLIEAANLINQTPNITPEGIHEYWCSYFNNNQPDHPCLIPFEQLSRTEKIKDELVIAIVKSILKYD